MEILTIGEAAELMGVHITTVRRLADKGIIEHTRTPGGHRRFSLSEISRFIPSAMQHLAIYVQYGQQEEIHRMAALLEELGMVPKMSIEERALDLTRPLYARPGIIRMAEYVGEGHIQGFVIEDKSIVGGWGQIQLIRLMHNLGMACFIAGKDNIEPFP